MTTTPLSENTPRWTLEAAEAIYHQPLLDLLLKAQTVHREHFPANTVQACTLYNIKSGGCPEDCGWCAQSVHHDTAVTPEPLAAIQPVIDAAKVAKANGATRFCLGAAWRGPTERNLQKVIDMVKAIKEQGLETCITLGKLTPHQALALKEAGLDYYNHNLETSEAHFEKVTTTRTYADRLATLMHVREAGIQVCCGGILGMGETLSDRIALLVTLANLPTPPQSVPINQLIPIPGTPLENAPEVAPIDFVRCVALARLLMPTSYVRLSAGRQHMSSSMQALCFMAGANSIFYGDKLLTVTNADTQDDDALLADLGMQLEDPKHIAGKSIPLTQDA